MTENLSYGAFDAQHPPSLDHVEDCVHCGFCLPSCPTYALWGEEMDSPRGRIHLVKLALEGEVELDADYRKHFDNCLGCMGCLSSCPSGVRYDLIVEATRAQLERKLPRTWSDSAFRRLILGVFPHRRRLRLAALGAWLFQTLGLRWLLRTLGLTSLLPARWRAMEGLAPPVQLLASLRGLPAPKRVAKPRAKVAMLEGCVQAVFFPDVNSATLQLLGAEGVEVLPVQDQGCCGALELHAGEASAARGRARELVERFEGLNVDAVLVNAAGCGSHLKQLGTLFDPSDPFYERALAFSAQVRDVLEWLGGLEPQASFRPLAKKVAYHDACHLAHAQGVRTEPRALLSRIPELEVLEIPNGEVCCGSAGIYNLVQPEAAEELGRRKAADLSSCGADMLVAANPGCLLQIQKHAPGALSCRHPIELLAGQLENRSGHG